MADADHLFFDANVLFSAAYRADSGLLRLWGLPDAVLVTSAYALAEARANLDTADALARLDRLVLRVTVIPQPPGDGPREGSALPAKDRPILAAAVAAHATHLLTGDRRHFGRFFGRRLAGHRVLTPGDYLRRRAGA